MARLAPLDFNGFIRERDAAGYAGAFGGAHAYAYASDQATRKAFERVKAVELVVAASVRLFKTAGKGQLLGQAVKIGPRQFPRVHALVRQCSDTLGIAQPTVYVTSSPHLNAATYGTNDDAFILLHSALVDHYSDEELLSVIGHECGHIHNNHVVYLTALHYLTSMAGLFVRHASAPAQLALRAWSRRAEITCDRAAVLCAGDAEPAFRALTKLALGSHKLYDELNIDAFIDQHHEAQESIGRYAELFATHPFLPKRVLALRIFCESELFRRHTKSGEGGLSMREVDERVEKLVKVLG